jgi:hypothetical protein
MSRLDSCGSQTRLLHCAAVIAACRVSVSVGQDSSQLDAVSNHRLEEDVIGRCATGLKSVSKPDCVQKLIGKSQDMSEWDSTRAFLGQGLVSYILGDEESPAFEDEREAAKKWLKGSFEPLASSGIYQFSALSITVANVLFAPYEDTGIRVIDYWRQRCGQEIFVPDEGDDLLVTQLLGIAADIYPVLILPWSGTGFGAWELMTQLLFKHPLHFELCRMILNPDEPLHYIFPGAPSPAPETTDFLDYKNPSGVLSVKSTLRWSTGDGSTIQLVGVVQSIIASAVSGYFSPNDLKGFLACVRQSLENARALALGNEVQLAALAEGYGLMPPEGSGWAELDPEVARLRRVTPVDRLQPWLGSSWNAGDQTVILEVAQAVKLLEISPGVPDFQDLSSADREQVVQLRENLERRIREVQLAVVLSSEEQERGFFISSIRRPLPLASGGGASSSPWARPPFRGNILVLTDDAVSQKLQILKELPASLDTAVAMIVSATSDRMFARDSFLDLMIAWENMLSVGAETKFKLCASTAWLLEPNNSRARFDVYTELSDIYDARSATVHGGKPGGRAKRLLEDMESLRSRCLELVKMCLERLLANRSLLIAKSDERVKSLVLQASHHDDR